MLVTNAHAQFQNVSPKPSSYVNVCHKSSVESPELYQYPKISYFSLQALVAEHAKCWKNSNLDEEVPSSSLPDSILTMWYTHTSFLAIATYVVAAQVKDSIRCQPGWAGGSY